MLGLHSSGQAFPSWNKQGLLFIAVDGLLIVVASLVKHRLWGVQNSVVVIQEISCSTAYGIFPYQGSNPCLLHWQADSQPLGHQGSPNPLLILKSLSVCHVRYCFCYFSPSFRCIYYPANTFSKLVPKASVLLLSRREICTWIFKLFWRCWQNFQHFKVLTIWGSSPYSMPSFRWWPSF